MPGFAGAGDPPGLAGAGDEPGLAGAGDPLGLAGAGDPLRFAGTGDEPGFAGAGDGELVGELGGTAAGEPAVPWTVGNCLATRPEPSESQGGLSRVSGP